MATFPVHVVELERDAPHEVGTGRGIGVGVEPLLLLGFDGDVRARHNAIYPHRVIDPLVSSPCAK